MVERMTDGDSMPDDMGAGAISMDMARMQSLIATVLRAAGFDVGARSANLVARRDDIDMTLQMAFPAKGIVELQQGLRDMRRERGWPLDGGESMCMYAGVLMVCMICDGIRELTKVK